MKEPERLQQLPTRLEPPKFWIGHIPFALYLVPLLKPEVVVELGTHSGNSFFAFCQAVKQTHLQTKCYAIDTWKGDEHSGYYQEEVYESVVKYQKENYPDTAVLMRVTFDEALAEFKDNRIDLLHIDGLHTYEGVKHDFESWLPKLSEKAIVLFHDTQIKMKDFGVWKFWEEISKKYPSLEFKHSCGLGVLAIGNKVPAEVLQFIKEENTNNKYRPFFEEEGKRILKEYNKLQLMRKVRSIFSIHRIIARKIKRPGN